MLFSNKMSFLVDNCSENPMCAFLCKTGGFSLVRTRRSLLAVTPQTMPGDATMTEADAWSRSIPTRLHASVSVMVASPQRAPISRPRRIGSLERYSRAFLTWWGGVDLEVDLGLVYKLAFLEAARAASTPGLDMLCHARLLGASRRSGPSRRSSSSFCTVTVTAEFMIRVLPSGFT